MRTDGWLRCFVRSYVFGRNKRVQVSNFGDENVRRVSADGLPLCCSDVLIVEKGKA